MSILQIEQPIVINKTLAEFIGINEAIVLQQINYWVCYNKKMQRNFYNGKYWTYNSISKWKEENFSFWSTKTLRRIIDNLIDKELLIKINDPTGNMNNIFWYTINDDGIKKLDMQYDEYQENLSKENYENDDEIIDNFDTSIHDNCEDIVTIEDGDTESGQNVQGYGQSDQGYGQNVQGYGQNVQGYGQNVQGCGQNDHATLITKTNQIYNKNSASVLNINNQLKNKIDCFTRNIILNKLLVDYVLMREKMNCSLSLDQLTMLLKRLDNLSKFTDTQISIVEQSIMGGYKSFFPVKSSKTYYKSKMDDYYISDKRQTDDYTESELKELLGISEEYGRFVGAQ